MLSGTSVAGTLNIYTLYGVLRENGKDSEERQPLTGNEYKVPIIAMEYSVCTYVRSSTRRDFDRGKHCRDRGLGFRLSSTPYSVARK